MNAKAASWRVVIWTNLRNFEKVCKQLFWEKEKYTMYRTGNVKKELGVEGRSLLKSQW